MNSTFSAIRALCGFRRLSRGEMGVYTLPLPLGETTD